MRKLVKLILVIGILVFTGCIGEKNDIPKELLGTYIQDAEYNSLGRKSRDQGIARLSKKGNRYYIEVDTKHIYDDEVTSTYTLQANGKIKEVNYQDFETGIIPVYGKYAKDIYNITFSDLKTTGKDGDELKYAPRITIIGERKLKTKEEDFNDYNSYYMNFKYESKPISVLWIQGKEFKKIKE